MKDEDGRIITEKIEVCQIRKQLPGDLFNISEEKMAETTASAGMTVRFFEKEDENITRDKAEKALKKQKAGKTVGLVGVTSECPKMGGSVCSKLLVGLFNVCLTTRRVPSDWRVACIVPLYNRNGDLQDCG